MPSKTAKEIGRVARHVAVPAVAYAATQDWIAPEGAQELTTLIELGAVGLAFAVVYIWSQWREWRAEKEKHDGT